MFGKRQRSLEKREERPSSQQTPKFQDPNIPFKTRPSLQSSGTNLVETNISLAILDPIDQSDHTIAARLNITPFPGEKKRFLDIESFSTFLLNYGGSDFPSGIELLCMQMGGIFDKEMAPTNVIASAQPLSVTSVLNSGGIIGYNVIYKLSTQVIWDITNVNVLTFKVRLAGETEPRPLPAAQPLAIDIKISHVIF